MNEFLSGIIEAALTYATPLPLTPEVTSEKPEVTENEVIIEAEPFADAHETTILHEFDAYNVPYSSATQECETVDEFVGMGDISSNVVTATDNLSQETFASPGSSDIVTLQPCVIPDTASSATNNPSPLKSLIESALAPDVHDNHKAAQRKRRTKPTNNEKDNQSTGNTRDAEYTFGVPQTLTKSGRSQNPDVSSSSYSATVDVKANGGPEVKKKRTRKREVIPDRAPPPQILPPCRVCDERSSGFHYGANTCEACKGFFRRTLKKKEVTFQCKCTGEEKAAWKRGPYKNGCPACRYERCLAIGMSKNAIKIGRYTLDRKTENIKEVKSLEAMDTLIQNAITEATNESSPESRSPSSFIEGLQLHSPGDISTINMAALLPPTPSPSTSSSEPPIKKQRSDTSTDEDSLMSTECVDPPELTLKEIDTIVKTLVDGQTQFRLIERRNLNMEAIREKQNKCLEQYTLKTALFGKMTMSYGEYMDFYRTTGLDLDNRLQDMRKFLQFFESRIALMVGFAKCIPGFKELDIDDQANLIKESRVESTLIGGYSLIMAGMDSTKQVIVTPWGKEYHIDEIDHFFPKEIILRRHHLARELGKLDNTKQEDAVLRALAIIAPDRCPLNAPEKAEQIQFKLLSCLQHLLSVRPGGTGNKLYKLFNMLTKIREFSHFEGKITNEKLLDIPELSSNYHLLSEFLR